MCLKSPASSKCGQWERRSEILTGLCDPMWAPIAAFHQSVALSADVAYYRRYELIWWRRRSWVHAISQSGCEIGRTQQKESQAKEAQFKWQPLLAPPSTRGNRPRQQEAPLDQLSSFHKQDVAVKVSLIDASHKYKTSNSERVICLFIFAHRTVIVALSPDRCFFFSQQSRSIQPPQAERSLSKRHCSWRGYCSVERNVYCKSYIGHFR